MPPVCQHPTINTGSVEKTNRVFVMGPTFYQECFVDRLVLIVDKLPDPNAGCEIHSQTVWPTL
jgi:hypothetical protein